MKVFFKTLNGECYEINCNCNIQLGELFQLFSDKATVCRQTQCSVIEEVMIDKFKQLSA